MMEFTINVDMNKKCKRCGHLGATQNGLCIKCTSEIIVKRIGPPPSSRFIKRGPIPKRSEET